MADVKWIKIVTDIFDDEKILLIESMPEADAIIVIWFKLLCLAGKQNNSGVFLLHGRIPYTEEMFATIFRRPINTVRLALSTFEQFGMIEIVNNTVTIPNWGKHQSIDQLENRKTYMREYMQEYRNKQKALLGVSKYNESGLDPEDWKTVLTEFNYECAYCGSKEDLEQDHVIPVNSGGTFTVENIVPACRRCNASKHDNEVFEWYEKQDFYDDERCKRLREHLRKTNVSALDKNREDKTREDKKKNTDKAPVKPAPVRHRYGKYENVLLSDEEMEKVKTEFPDDWQDRIEKMSEYMASNGKSYKNYLAAIRNWKRMEDERGYSKQSAGGAPGKNSKANEWAYLDNLI